MKRVQLALPDEVYYELQAKAGKAHMDTKEYLKRVLTEEAGVVFESAEDGENLYDFACDWDWPNGQLKRGTGQADNVVGVLKHMAEGYDFAAAVKRRAEEARQEDSDRGQEYHKTVRANCTKAGHGTTSSAEEFKREAKMILEHF